MKNITHIIIYTVLITLVVVLGIFLYITTQGAEGGGEQKEEWGVSSFELTPKESIESSSTEASQTVVWETYTNTKYGFSLSYPSGFTIGSFKEGDGEVILFQNSKERQGFQILITPFDEEIDITEERIRTDLPDVELRSPQVVELGERSGKGLAFLSNNQAFGEDSREVWFVFKGHLYQVSTYTSLDIIVQRVMNSWQFK